MILPRREVAVPWKDYQCIWLKPFEIYSCKNLGFMMVLFVFKNSDGSVQIREAVEEKLFLYSINSFSQYFLNPLMFTGLLTSACNRVRGWIVK